MDINLIKNWLIDDIDGTIKPAGCYTEYLPSPFAPKELCCTMGIVHEHRFAFYYWAQFFQKTITKSNYSKFAHPILVTIDFHDDVGCDGDFSIEEITRLNLHDKLELGLFCWLRLRSLNDGHILPALYLNFFSDAFVLLKQGVSEKRRTIKDRYNKIHTIHYFNDHNKLLKKLNDNHEQYIFLDVDLDYFARKEDEEELKGATKIVDENILRGCLSLNNPIVNSILSRLIGITVALEPDYCGGITNSLKILNILNEELFDCSLFTEKCRWKQ